MGWFTYFSIAFLLVCMLAIVFFFICLIVNIIFQWRDRQDKEPRGFDVLPPKE